MKTGTPLSNRYRIEEKLGEGGMGVVYKAHDTVLDRSVAIKILSPREVGDGAARLVREARSVARLDHPHIVAVYDAGEVEGHPFIVMQLVSGKSLRDTTVTVDQAVVFARQICQALDHAHSRGVIHRDIKPDNIMVTDGGIVKMMDFGLARSEGRTRLTQTGMIVGTVAYMAPELVLRGEADGRSDLYSLGCVLYEVITGRPPFTGDDPISIISQHLQVPPVAPRWYNAAVSPELEGVLLKLMAKDPAERYASAQDVLAALEQLTATPPPAQAVAAGTVEIRPALLLGSVLHTRLVGRDAELRELKSSVDVAASSQGQLVLAEGEPGIGKTRLLQEVAVYARLRGFTVLLGRCYEQETGTPYLPFIELFQARFRGMTRPDLLDELGGTAAEFVTLIPEVLKTLPDVQPSPTLEPVHERLRLFASIAEYLTTLSRRIPVVLTLEDLHWADAASLNLLQHLARALRGERVLILGSYRDVDLDSRLPLSDALREMNRERLYRRVVLRRLAREGVGSMVQTMLELTGQVTDEFLDLLYGETEGNPFFVEEILKDLVEQGAVYREDGRWERKKIAELDVPRSIKEVIGRRLERVSEACQHVLSLAAIIGRRFHFEVLQAIGELREEAVL
ncbi:MAG: protein kinase domain-containing protein, partial [bacterium]